MYNEAINSLFENNRMDIKGSIILELVAILEISTGYLLNDEYSAGEKDEVEQEMLVMLRNMKNDKLRQVALEQLRTLPTINK